MFIQTQETPNPNSLKFLPGKKVSNDGPYEFLNQNQRVPAKTGRGCIFPADFPYVHRGNPPLDKDKYIVTSWFLAT